MNKHSFLSSFVLALLACSSTSFAQCQDKLLAGSATAQDQFGFAVAQSPRYAVVGALFEAGAGAAYVYEPAGGGWRQSGRLVAGQPTGADQFGSAVAVSGATVLVGAPFSGFNSMIFTGSAHVFTPDGTDWLEAQVLRASDVAADDQFGFSVSVDGNRMAVGAPFKSLPGVATAGAVYLFELLAGTWVEVDKLIASDAATGDAFGLSVSISGDTVFVGAPFDDDGGVSAGSAYVFEFDGTSWNEQPKMLASSPGPNDEFGRSLAVEGDTAVVGARNDDDGGNDAGAAYTFQRNGTVWSSGQKLTAVLPAANDRFGSSVSIDEGLIAVGSPFHDNPGPDRGAAHLFVSNGGGWTEFLTLNASDGMSFDRFGSSVAVGAGRVLVGAPQNDEFAANAGAAYGIPFAGPDCNNNGILDACEATPYLDFCFGNGGNGAGCTNCPCGNNASSNSWGGCLNGAAASARVVPSGNPALFSDTFRIDMVDGNPGTFALLISGTDQLPRNTSNPCFEYASGIRSFAFDGLRCVGGAARRHGTRATDSNGAVGITNEPWGDSAFFIAIAGFLAGETRYYQAIYRELPSLVCNTGLNTSQAFSVTFLP